MDSYDAPDIDDEEDMYDRQEVSGDGVCVGREKGWEGGGEAVCV